jgi:hypothetical protein
LGLVPGARSTPVPQAADPVDAVPVAPARAAPASPPTPAASAPAIAPAPTPTPTASAPASQPGQINLRVASAAPSRLPDSKGASADASYEVVFEFDRPTIDRQKSPEVDRIIDAVSRGAAASITVLASDTETMSPIKRSEMTVQRLNTLRSLLTERSIAPGRISVTWVPLVNERELVREGSSGFQRIAMLAVSRS